MVQFIYGNRKCGKSLWAEKQMDSFYRKLYFGTLWKSKKFQESIDKHIERRDCYWSLIESSGNIELDLNHIDRSIHSFDSVLIDGLMTWLINVSRNDLNYHCHAYQLIVELTRIIVSSPKVNWILIDVFEDSIPSIKEKFYIKYLRVNICSKLKINPIFFDERANNHFMGR